jgi:hypothetical protein
MVQKILSVMSAWTCNPSRTESANYECCADGCRASMVYCWRFEYGNWHDHYFYKELDEEKGEWFKVRWLCDDCYKDYLKLRNPDNHLKCDHAIVLTAQEARDLANKPPEGLKELFDSIRLSAEAGLFELQISASFSEKTKRKLLDLGYGIITRGRNSGDSNTTISWSYDEDNQ